MAGEGTNGSNLTNGTSTQPDRLDAHEKPPEGIRNVYKVFQKLDRKSLETHAQVIDATTDNAGLHTSLEGLTKLPDELQQIFQDFLSDANRQDTSCTLTQTPVLRVKSIPGLFIYPALLPSEVQVHLLNKLLHRDLSHSGHNTNVHLHYNVSYPTTTEKLGKTSFFDRSASTLIFEPKDASVHKPVTIQQFLNRKLRWVTLGGQYDWTNKIYPSNQPPLFPSDLKQLLEDIFPMKAEAAIVNLYSPGDALSLHRDVSEESNQPLVSISLGCDGVFVIGLDEIDNMGNQRIAALRLRSGDAVLMSGESRYAWHGVPKILKGTCPDWIKDWPYQDAVGDDEQLPKRFEQWRGWMQGKRINLNVRQMFDGE